MYDRKETTQQAAARLGLPEMFTAMHEGRHVCIDGRRYNVSCLITDPDCDDIARARLGRGQAAKRIARECAAPRKVTVFEPCQQHAGMYASVTRYRRAEVMLEGGWAGSPCDGQCRMRPGTDFYTADFVTANPVYVVGAAPQ
jgi:hypothetical protein